MMAGLLDRLEQPAVRQGLLFLLVTGLLWPFPWANGPLGAMLGGLPRGLVPLAAAALLAALVVLNFRLLARLPFPLQAILIWVELSGLFLLF